MFGLPWHYDQAAGTYYPIDTWDGGRTYHPVELSDGREGFFSRAFVASLGNTGDVLTNERRALRSPGQNGGP